MSNVPGTDTVPGNRVLVPGTVCTCTYQTFEKVEKSDSFVDGANTCFRRMQ